MEQKVLERMKKALTLSYEITETTDTTVFFEYIPHVNAFDIHFYRGGWSRDKEREVIADCATLGVRTLNNAIAQLEVLKAQLIGEGENEEAD